MAHMQVLAQANITLKGSADIVTEFFGYSIHTILYQRGIYPPESFTRVSKYGLTLLVSTDPEITSYLKNVLDQMTSWIEEHKVQKLVVAVCGIESGETLERWVFDIQADVNHPQYHGKGTKKVETKTEKQITMEIQSVIRQITASVTFLPLLQEPCSFDLLIYTDKGCEVPLKWEESDPKYIKNQQEVKLRSFSTDIHKVDTMVSYAVDTDIL